MCIRDRDIIIATATHRQGLIMAILIVGHTTVIINPTSTIEAEIMTTIGMIQEIIHLANTTAATGQEGSVCLS